MLNLATYNNKNKHKKPGLRLRREIFSMGTREHVSVGGYHMTDRVAHVSRRCPELSAESGKRARKPFNPTLSFSQFITAITKGQQSTQTIQSMPTSLKLI